jgi:hypothetical protein
MTDPTSDPQPQPYAHPAPPRQPYAQPAPPQYPQPYGQQPPAQYPAQPPYAQPAVAQPPYGQPPQPHPGQPPQPHPGQPPQPHPGQPYTAAPQHPAPAASGRGLGVMALILGLLPAIFGAFTPLLYASAYATFAYSQIGLLTGASSLLAFAIGTTAVILGAVAVRRRGPGLVPGAIGIGLGIAVLVSTLLGLLVSFAATGGSYFF